MPNLEISSGCYQEPPKPPLKGCGAYFPGCHDVACSCPTAKLFPRNYPLLKGAVSCYGSCLPHGTLNSMNDQRRSIRALPLCLNVLQLWRVVSASNYPHPREISGGLYCLSTTIQLLSVPNAAAHISAQVLLLTAFLSQISEHKSLFQSLFAKESDSLIHHFPAPWTVPVDVLTWSLAEPSHWCLSLWGWELS